MANRHQARQKAVQILYQMDLTQKWSDTALEEFINHFEVSDDEAPFVTNLVNGIMSRRSEIDEHIQKNSDNWKISRIAPIDRNLLRLGTYELLFSEETPRNIVINEAVELAKTFGDTKSPGFINGILDSIANTKVAV